MEEAGRYRELVGGVAAIPSQELPGVLENPDDGSFVAKQRQSEPAQVEAALEAARIAWLDGGWSGLDLERRASLVRAFADRLEPRAAEIAQLDSLDSGLPISIARAMAGSLAESIRGAVETALAAGEARELDGGERRIEVLRLPWGPAALLNPWNAPAANATGKIAMGLLAGCPVILKPSEYAPSFAAPFIEAAIEAELPVGSFQVLHGGPEVASRLVTDERIKVIVLTGGQATGRAVAAAAAARMVSTQLELGGTNPALVAADAEVGPAAAALAAGMTKLNGQWCEAPRRIIVDRSLHDDLVEALRERLEAIEVGPASADTTAFGPLSHRGHRDLVLEQIGALGGTVVTTAATPPGDGFFVSPTIVLGAAPEATRSEIFGPVVTIHPVDDDEEALALANRNGDGLAGYVFSGDRDHAFALGERIAAGEIRIGGTNLLDLAAGSTQSFWGSSGVGGHGSSEVFEVFRGTRIVGEDDASLPI